MRGLPRTARRSGLAGLLLVLLTLAVVTPSRPLPGADAALRRIRRRERLASPPPPSGIGAPRR